MAHLLALLDELKPHLDRFISACRTTESYYESIPGFRGTVRTTAAARAALERLKESLG